MAASPLLGPLPRSLSTSRQFVVYGDEPQMRGVICDAGERLKDDLLDRLQEKDDWRTPIVVYLQRPQANRPELPAAQLTVSQTGFGLKLQLDLLLSRQTAPEQLERELLRAILLERVYRNHAAVPAGSAVVTLPPWLVDGMLASDSARMSRSLKGFAESGRTFGLKQLLRQNPDLLDGPSRELYQAHCAALLRLMSDAPNGRAVLANFLSALPDLPDDPTERLRQHFPGLVVEDESAEAAWRKKLARFANAQTFAPIEIDEVEVELTRLQRVKFPARSGHVLEYPLMDFQKFITHPLRKRVLRERRKEFMLLATRANPLYRALVLEYEQIVWQLERGKTRRIRERLLAAADTARKLGTRWRAMDDYLNWFEATQAAERSGSFDGYLKAAAEAKTPAPPRRDAISTYLTSLETQFK